MLAVELIPDPKEGGYTARLPDIPAYGEGDSPEEAIADLREALRGYIFSIQVLTGLVCTRSFDSPTKNRQTS